MDDTADQAKAIDASITAAFYNGMEQAAKLVDWLARDMDECCPGPTDQVAYGVGILKKAAISIRATIKESKDG